MTDMRQKLLPVFLEESERMLLQLEGFLSGSAKEEQPLEELEAAFRAAHTLKGTAALVQASAVCTLSGRIEGMLEGHFMAGHFPSAVEYEAMQLALERLRQLISAVESNAPEPPSVLAEAELALKLAGAMPGRKGLAELLRQDPGADPFAEDPVVSADEPAGEGSIDDPFAEDPSFDAVAVNTAAVPDDPFADDPELVTSTASVETPEALSDPSPLADPFADDPDLDLDAARGTSEDQAVAVPEDPFADDPSLDMAPSVAAEPGAAQVLPDDPFGEDPDPAADSFVDGSVGVAEQLPAVEIGQSAVAVPAGETAGETYAEKMRRRLESETAVGTAERLASTLLARDDVETEERNFSCCCFDVGNKSYHLPIANMIEITDLPPIIRLPLAPPVVRGLINLRGKVLPVIDLSVREGEAGQYVAVKKLVIAEANGEQLAFLTDGIPDLAEEVRGEKVDVASFVEQFRAGAS